jgi:hypothetical protein
MGNESRVSRANYNENSGSIHNLRRVFNQSTSMEVASGMQYYATQAANISAISDHYKVNFVKAAAAFSAISPNLSEVSNYIGLEALCYWARNQDSDVKFTGYGTNVAKAKRLLTCESSEVQDLAAILRGRKILDFFFCTLDPTYDKPVVDGHMINAWVGKVRRLNAIGSVGDRLYRTVQEDVAELAGDYNLPASSLQSILWLTWKRTNRIVYDPQLDLEFPFAPRFRVK